MNKPNVNVTPLIDVLLVLLIIFMVVTPLKPSSFKARIPNEPRPTNSGDPHPDTLAVIVSPDGELKLNTETGLGSVDDGSKLEERLKIIFSERIANGSISESHADSADRPYRDRIERTVFIKAPRSLEYGSVARIVDTVKAAGAYPISLQIDGLD
ncbi:MAG: biopolymer transporter ExbD [Pyrinomonadaceae bacterium]|nr:biopolymer transporter ExbD [Pyrinomonadaceae bacterium]